MLIGEYLSGPGSWTLEGLLAEPLMANVRDHPETERLRQQRADLWDFARGRPQVANHRATEIKTTANLSR